MAPVRRAGVFLFWQWCIGLSHLMAHGMRSRARLRYGWFQNAKQISATKDSRALVDCESVVPYAADFLDQTALGLLGLFLDKPCV
jgi:hypothetical protein